MPNFILILNKPRVKILQKISFEKKIKKKITKKNQKSQK